MELTTLEAVLIGAAPFVLLIGAATIFIGKKKSDNSTDEEKSDSQKQPNESHD